MEPVPMTRHATCATAAAQVHEACRRL